MIAKLHRYLVGPGLGPLLLKAVSGSAGLRIVGMGFGFLVGVQLARQLGSEGYGIYGVAMSIIALLTVPTEFGLPQLLTREVASAQARHEWSRLKGILQWSYRTSLWISAAISLMVITSLLLTGSGLSSSLGMTLLAGVAMVPVAAQLSIRSAAVRGLQLVVRGQVPDVLFRPLFHSLLLFLVPWLFMPLSPALAMALGVLAAGIALIAASYMLSTALPSEVATVSPITESKYWWSSALPMALTEGMRLVQGHVLILLLGWLVAMSDVGIYRVGSSIMLLIAMPISLFNIVSMPLIARLHSSGEQWELQKMLSFISVGMTGGAAVLSAPFFIAGDWVLAHVFGGEFGASGAIVSMLCLGVMINAFFGVSAVTLNMIGLQVRVTRASFSALIVLAASAIPLIIALGVLGAAVSHVLSLLVWNLMMWRDARIFSGLDTSILGIRHIWVT